jgi:hypothetical protein
MSPAYPFRRTWKGLWVKREGKGIPVPELR